MEGSNKVIKRSIAIPLDVYEKILKLKQRYKGVTYYKGIIIVALETYINKIIDHIVETPNVKVENADKEQLKRTIFERILKELLSKKNVTKKERKNVLVDVGTVRIVKKGDLLYFESNYASVPITEEVIDALPLYAKILRVPEQLLRDLLNKEEVRKYI